MTKYVLTMGWDFVFYRPEPGHRSYYDNLDEAELCMALIKEQHSGFDWASIEEASTGEIVVFERLAS